MMKIAGFEFAEGARFQKGAKADPNVVGKHLEFLREQFKGEITPEDILQDAENPNSPLHPFFEWDDTDAARQYRLQQARGLIRAVVAIYVHDDQPATKMRAYVHVAGSGEEPHYREVSHAMSVKSSRDYVLEKAKRELRAWCIKYHDLKEFAEIMNVIDSEKAA